MPTGLSAAEMLPGGKGIGDKILKLDKFVALIRERLEASGVKNWEVSVEGSLEAGTGFLPGAKVSFKATITVSSK